VAGERDIPAIEAEGRAALEAVPFRVDYFSVRQASTLAPATEGMHDLVVLTAVRLGKARLLDNLRVRWPCCP
jgi:pantoate--beta-alanine ligase